MESSEQIAQREKRVRWLKRIYNTVVPGLIILGVVVVVFFDPRALVLGFTAILGVVLYFMFTSGSSKKRSSYSSQSSPSLYTTPEGYNQMVKDAHTPRPNSPSGPNSPSKQSQLGANISNLGIVALMIVAVIVVWLFG